jgi:pimeloyl-ACP methyl ester carboxylesterase
MIFFNKSRTVAPNMVRNFIGIFVFAIVFLSGVYGSCSQHEVSSSTQVPSAKSQVADFQKLEPALKFLRERNERTYAITAPNGIDEATYVKIGGIEQWITIRGEDRKNPVLLFLHGGPGDATNPWGFAAFRSWLKYFTVVQWDQRGAGKTFGRNPDSKDTITLDRMTQDGIELAEYLRTTLHKKKIILLGHSFGSLLGNYIVKARPDLFCAFVGTGFVADPPRMNAVAREDLLRKAKELGNDDALRELRQNAAYPVQRKWSMRFEGSDRFLNQALGAAIVAPHSTERDIDDWFDGQVASSDRLFPGIAQIPREQLAGKFALPVIVIDGADDLTAPPSLAAEFIQSIRAPQKEFVTIPGGHFAVFTNEQAFRRELVKRVLPLCR